MYVYILKCADNSYYIGVTNNLELRIRQHQQGIIKSCYTYSRRPVNLAFYQNCQTPMAAILMEKKLKGWSRRKKEALINGNFSLLHELSECKNERNSKNFFHRKISFILRLHNE